MGIFVVPLPTPVQPALVNGKRMATDDVTTSEETRLTDKHNDDPYIFKTDSVCTQEARPSYGHPIRRNWLPTSNLISDGLKSIGVKWTSIHPKPYIDTGEAEPSPCIIAIGVRPHSLSYDDAVAAADVVKKILSEADFPDVEVAFVEMVDWW